MYENVHTRRMKLVYSPSTVDQLEWVPIGGYECIGIFENLFGIPTDIDKVWEEREAYMDEINDKNKNLVDIT